MKQVPTLFLLCPAMFSSYHPGGAVDSESRPTLGHTAVTGDPQVRRWLWLLPAPTAKAFQTHPASPFTEAFRRKRSELSGCLPGTHIPV